MTTAVDAPAERGSAYPPGLDQLLPDARALIGDEGELPSRNKLMEKLRIGAPKANALLEKLAAEQAPEPGDEPGHDSEPGSHPDAGPDPQVVDHGHPDPDSTPTDRRPLPVWPLVLIGIPAAVSIWVGWVGLGGLTGFGEVHPLPGIVDDFQINSAITLPVGMEAYAAFALRAWLGGGRVPTRARRFAKWSAIGALVLGALGQVAYHVMTAAGVTAAPWQITTAVSCLPVAVLGMGAALAHLLREER